MTWEHLHAILSLFCFMDVEFILGVKGGFPKLRSSWASRAALLRALDGQVEKVMIETGLGFMTTLSRLALETISDKAAG